MRKKSSVCIFAQVPPPFHGSNYATKLLLESEFVRIFDVTHINTSYVQSLQNIGKPQLRKFIAFGRYLIKLYREDTKKHFAYIIMIPSFSFWTFVKDSIAILFASYCLNSKLILWIHTNDFGKHYSNSNRLLKFYMLHVTKKAFKIVVVGRRLKDNFVGYIPSDKLTVIYNGLPAEACAIRSHGKDERIVVIFLSNMMLEKGWHDLFIAANRVCSEYENVIFTFYGAASRECSIESINDEFSQSPYSDRIVYRGIVAGDAKDQALHEADIFCLPSYSEAFPFSILEAMQYGLAVIATDTGSVSEAIRDREGGILLKSNTIEELVGAIVYFVANPDQIIKMGEFNRRRFDDTFSIERTVEEWKELLGSSVSM